MGTRPSYTRGCGSDEPKLPNKKDRRRSAASNPEPCNRLSNHLLLRRAHTPPWTSRWRRCESARIVGFARGGISRSPVGLSPRHNAIPMRKGWLKAKRARRHIEASHGDIASCWPTLRSCRGGCDSRPRTCCRPRCNSLKHCRSRCIGSAAWNTMRRRNYSYSCTGRCCPQSAKDLPPLETIQTPR
jgi:hypothetical protein